MRFRIFEPIVSAEEEMPLCNLAHLFNAYMSRLSTLEVAAYPQESLSLYHRLTVNIRPEDHGKVAMLNAAQDQYYTLTVVNNSLHDLHLCVLAACNALSDLFNLYDGDLHRYAIQNRLRCLAEFVPGTEDDLADMHPADLADFQSNWEQGVEGQPWQPIYKDDAESLAPYTLLSDLAHFFAPLQEDYSIERIGTTPPEEWDYFTEVVKIYSSSQPKASQLSEGAGVYRANPTTGEMEQQSVAQRVENEVNDEMKDVRVASYFQQTMRRLQFVAGLSVMLTDAASYRQLHDELVAIRDQTCLSEPAQAFND